MGYLTYATPAALSQSGQLGQSDWQTINSAPSQQASGQPLGQSEWQNPGGNSSGFNQAPGLTANPGNSTGAQTGGTTPNPWQNPSVNQSSNAQQNSDYYYGQINQGQQSPYAFNNGQYQQGQVNNSTQPNNQTSNNLPPASSIPTQPNQTQKSHDGGLKKTLAGLARTATQAAGMGMGVAAPLAGVYMMSRAMTNTTPSYGYPGAMPYNGYGGYGGYPAPMPYAAPNYAMMNMAPMYSSALSGLSSFMTH